MVLVTLVTVLEEAVFRPPLVPEVFSVTVGRVEIVPSTALVGVRETLGSSKFLVVDCLVGEAEGVTIEPSSWLAAIPKRFSSRLAMVRLERE